MDKFIPSISLTSHISNSCMCCVCRRPSLNFNKRSLLEMTKILLHVLGAMQWTKTFLDTVFYIFFKVLLTNNIYMMEGNTNHLRHHTNKSLQLENKCCSSRTWRMCAHLMIQKSPLTKIGSFQRWGILQHFCEEFYSSCVRSHLIFFHTIHVKCEFGEGWIALLFIYICNQWLDMSLHIENSFIKFQMFKFVIHFKCFRKSFYWIVVFFNQKTELFQWWIIS
jgi:hypothetical protein